MTKTTFTSQFWRCSLMAASLLTAITFSAAGCKSKAAQAPITNGTPGDIAQDPAAANLALPSGQGSTQVLGANVAYTPQQSSENYSQQGYPEGQQAPAPIVRGTPADQQAVGDYSYNNVQPDNNQDIDNQGYDTETAGEEAIAETDQAPPPLPEYDQPPAPEDDYIWTPGYWGWGTYGYYWVPGAWVAPPYYGALWTPPYWGWYGGRYRFHRGYWGPHVGFYGGVDYGFGYIGYGYFGGYWSGNHFFYNRAVTNIDQNRIHNFYNRDVIYNGRRYNGRIENRVSYNGGPGGLRIAPRAPEITAMHEFHTAPLAAQRQFHAQAAQNRAQYFGQNHGRPAQAAFDRPLNNPHGIAAPPQRAAEAIQQRNAALQQRNSNMQQRNFQQQQRNNVEQQRGAELQQRNLQEQQHNNMQQQRGAELQQRNNLEQQRGAELQQRNLQEQQRNNLEQQRMQEQQRNPQQPRFQQQPQVQQQPRTQEQQRNFQQPRVDQQPQLQQQQHMQEQPRSFQQPRFEQQPQVQPQPRVQEQPRSFQQPRVQPQPQVQPQPRVQEQPRSFQQPRVQQQPQVQQQPRFQQQPRMENRPAAQAPRPSGGERGQGEHQDGGHPR